MKNEWFEKGLKKLQEIDGEAGQKAKNSESFFCCQAEKAERRQQ